MPLLKFRNFNAATRKPNMLQFGMYRQEASADIEVIEGITAGGGTLAITGTQNGTNTTFTLSATPQSGGLIFARNGVLQSVGGDYTIVGNVLTLLVAPDSADILLAISIGGQ